MRTNRKPGLPPLCRHGRRSRQGAVLVAALVCMLVVMMVLGKLVARTRPQIQPPYQPQPREKPQRPVYRNHPNPGTPGPYALEALMLLGRNSRQYRQALRRGLVPTSAYPPHSCIEPHVSPSLIEIIFHLQDSKGG